MRIRESKPRANKFNIQVSYSIYRVNKRVFQSKIKMKYKEQKINLSDTLFQCKRKMKAHPKRLPSTTAMRNWALPSQKKRGRPTKKVAEPKVVGTVQWTDLMVEALLKNRLHTFKVDFLSAKEKNAVIRGWLKVVLAINAIGHSVVDSVKARNKYQTLKSTYRKYSAELNETGNNDIDDPPNNWEVMVFYFQGRKGLTGEVLASSDACEPTPIVDSSPFAVTPMRGATVKRQKTDLGDAIIRMGTEVGEGLRNMGAASMGNNSLEELKKLITENHVAEAALREKEVEEQRLFRAMLLGIFQNKHD